MNSTIEMCVHHFTHNLRTVFRHGHGTSVNSVSHLIHTVWRQRITHTKVTAHHIGLHPYEVER